MSINNLISYEVLGTREEFAGWVSNISPHDTPFTSLTGKTPINNKVFEWQTDRLDVVHENAWSEDMTKLPDPLSITTELHSNYTQILRKVVQVSNTAESMDSYGRGSELEYQIEKATKEIKRDLESVFLSMQVKQDENIDSIRRMSGFYDLTSKIDEAEPTTGAVTHRKLTGDTFTEEDVWNICEGLYMAGSRANIIMFHPNHAKVFSDMFENNGSGRVALYDNESETVSRYVNKITDPWGQEFTLLPNVLMDEYVIYFFHPHDWFQRVLREPTVTALDTTGSSESWMIEMELGLQHRNPWSSGILEMTYTRPDYSVSINSVIGNLYPGMDPVQLSVTSRVGTLVGLDWTSSDSSIAVVNTDGLLTVLKDGDFTINVTAHYPRNETETASIDLTAVPVSFTINQIAFNVTKSKIVNVSSAATLTPQEASNKGFTYSVLNPEKGYITVDPTTGDVTGVISTPDDDFGIVKMVSNFNKDYLATIAVIVDETSHETSITGPRTMFVGETKQYTVTITDAGATKVEAMSTTNLTVTTPVKVNETTYTFNATAGLTPVTNTAVGVTVTYPDGKGSASTPVDINDYLLGFSDGYKPTDGFVGTRKRVGVHTNEPDAGASHIANWTSSDDSVASVVKEADPDDSNKVHAFVHYNKEGTAIITATVNINSTVGDRTATQSIVSSNPVFRWGVAPVDGIVGDKQDLTVVTSSTGVDMSNYPYVIKSSDPTIISVSGKEITLLKNGSSTISYEVTMPDSSVVKGSKLVKVVSVTFSIQPNTLAITVGNEITQPGNSTIFKVSPASVNTNRFIYTPVTSGDSGVASVTETQLPNGSYQYTYKSLALGTAHYKVGLYDIPSITADHYIHSTVLNNTTITTNPANLFNKATAGDVIIFNISQQGGVIKNVDWNLYGDDENRVTGKLVSNHGNTGNVNDWSATFNTSQENTNSPSGDRLQPGDYPVLNTIKARVDYVDGKSITVEYPITVSYPA